MDNDVPKGFERVDPTPVAVPVRFKGQFGDGDRLRSMMSQLFVELKNKDHVESFEESLDFHDDEDDPVSPSEMRYMQEEKLLTEHEEARRVVTERVNHDTFHKRRMSHGRKDGEQGVHGSSGGVAAERVADGGEKSGASDRGGNGRGREGGVAAEKG